MLALLGETDSFPTAEDVAERADVSRRTVFRLFDDMEGLMLASTKWQQAEVKKRFGPPNLAGLSLEARITALVTHITSIYEFVTPVRKFAERVRYKNEAIERNLRAQASEFRRKLTIVFSDALSEFDEAELESRLQAVDLVLSWQSWHTLRRHQRCSNKLARQTVETSLRRLLLD